MNTDCIFCKIAKKKIDAQVVYEDEDILAFKDIKPQAPVHYLFIPKKHIETLNDIRREDADMLAKILLAVREVADKEGVAQGGYRVVINCNRDAGQEVFHVHVHLLGGRGFSWPPG
ncbi:MAG: histidine triad nucleotide-binding protein [Candidatus Omnitrophota bacterium]|nr:histidine triad nucleotide-binding protein [Candidatus Omnitrophota bacterium]